MPPLHAMTLAELSALIASRRLSPVELTRSYLDRIAALDGGLNSVLHTFAESALAEAAAAEAEIAAGRHRGALHGIPIGIKDIYDVAGDPTTGHSALCRNNVAQEDSAAVAKLRAAGAIILAKLATWEFAIGGASFDLPWPPARNPWDPSRDPAGSSSGSGVAVAAGFVPGAMGSDTGGSIRTPAAWCGIAGHKPTYGLISRRGIYPLAWSLDTAGPMAWTAQDCALMLEVLAGHDPRDPASAVAPVEPYAKALTGSLKGLRVGVLRHFYEKDLPAEPEVCDAMEDSLRAFRDLGAVVKDVQVSPFGDWAAAGNIISRAESHAIHRQHLKATPELYGEYARRRLMAGAFLSAADYIDAQRQRAILVAEMAAVMQDVDVVVFPSARETARLLGAETMGNDLPAPFYSRPFNMTGSPTVSVCNGFSAAGLPFGIQIGGRAFADGTVLRVGDALERALGTRSRRPSLSMETAA